MTVSINSLVAQRISGANQEIQNAVVEHLASKEIERRTNAVVQAIVELNKMNSELNKIRPDIVAYDETGKEASSNWSKARLQEKTNCRKKLRNWKMPCQRHLTKAISVIC